jgi:ABC-type transport system substrate-binding protein
MPFITKVNSMQQQTLIHLAQSLPITLDPAVAYDSASTAAIQNIYETLVTYAGSQVREVFPLLAESWEVSDDNRYYSFQVRPGVRFHNGNPLRDTLLSSINSPSIIDFIGI